MQKEKHHEWRWKKRQRQQGAEEEVQAESEGKEEAEDGKEKEQIPAGLMSDQSKVPGPVEEKVHERGDVLKVMAGDRLFSGGGCVSI